MINSFKYLLRRETDYALQQSDIGCRICRISSIIIRIFRAAETTFRVMFAAGPRPITVGERLLLTRFRRFVTQPAMSRYGAEPPFLMPGNVSFNDARAALRRRMLRTWSKTRPVKANFVARRGSRDFVRIDRPGDPALVNGVGLRIWDYAFDAIMGVRLLNRIAPPSLFFLRDF
jgi:hypothetical protein